jgi:hypothetical protein
MLSEGFIGVEKCSLPRWAVSNHSLSLPSRLFALLLSLLCRFLFLLSTPLRMELKTLFFSVCCLSLRRLDGKVFGFDTCANKVIQPDPHQEAGNCFAPRDKSLHMMMMKHLNKIVTSTMGENFQGKVADVRLAPCQ